MRLLQALLLLLMIGPASAQAEPTPLPAEQAFALTGERAADGVSLRWRIAPGTYLYREHIAVRGADGVPVPFATPTGVMKDDPNFGPVEIYRGETTATLPSAAIAKRATLTVSFQGCTDGGLCYPPVHKALDLRTLAVSEGAPVAAPEPPTQPDTAAIEPGDGSALLGRAAIGWTLLAFLGFGLALSLTPCIYPMVPILVGIVAGQCSVRPGRMRSLALSSTYVLAMASAYAVLGLAAAWSGLNLQVALQSPLALGMMAAVLLVLALGMFGAIELALPAVATSTERPVRSAGMLRAAGLGFGAALVVGPCVTPPLAAALIYIARSGDLMQGAAALFALGLGMGLPLILVGTFGAHLMPRSGDWLVKVRQLFGFLLIGTAIMLVSRVLPGQATLLLWAALALALGVFLGAFDRLAPRHGLVPRMFKATGLLAVIYGAALAVGASAGGEDPLRPLAGWPRAGTAAPAATMAVSATVTGPADLATAIGAAPAARPVVVQVTADWCTICKDIERDVLADAAVQSSLAGFTVIRADVTRDGEATRALMKRLRVVGPPTLLVLEPGSGREITAARVTGMTSPAAFLSKLAAARAL